MSQIRLSPKARGDLDAIWDYTAQRWDVDQAEDYLRLLGRSMNLLAASPELGGRIDDVRKGYRRFPSASHVIFYRIKPGHIEVIRILHSRMDADRHL